MFLFVFYLLCITPAFSKPRYTDLDEEDQQLFRAVFDTPSYDQEENEEDDLDLGKMDLLKDGIWAIKAKLTELRAFNRALVSNLLSTKMKLKDLLTNHLPAKKHQHEMIEKKKPTHNMYSQPPPYYPQHAQYEPQHAMPQYPHDPYYGH
ncbi:uncharacterized protein [Epargyreus clarus]|uniref:uncharacterized protein n=1 Tax=Epargyreus clarus TaxID=520877 RepID=UPI003C2E8C8B